MYKRALNVLRAPRAAASRMKMVPNRDFIVAASSSGALGHMPWQLTIVPLQHVSQWTSKVALIVSTVLEELETVFDGIFLSSTKKKRRMKMNKHKLKKRRKKGHMNTKQSRS